MTFADLIHRAFAWLYNNKQSVLGTLTAGLAFVQASPTLRNLLAPATYEWTMFAIGLLMVLFARSAAGGTVVSKVLPPSITAERPTKEGGYVRPLMLAVLLAVSIPITALTVTSCASIGLQPAKSFDEGWAYALGQTTALRQAAADGVRTGSLTADDGEYVLKVTDQSRALLDAARAAHGAGDVETAEGRLALTTSILAQLQAYLRAKGGAS